MDALLMTECLCEELWLMMRPQNLHVHVQEALLYLTLPLRHSAQL